MNPAPNTPTDIAVYDCRIAFDNIYSVTRVVRDITVDNARIRGNSVRCLTVTRTINSNTFIIGNSTRIDNRLAPPNAGNDTVFARITVVCDGTSIN